MEPNWIVRWSAAALLMCGCLWFLSMGASAGTALFAASCAILSMICISPETSRWGSWPFTSLIDSIYFGENTRERPALNLKVARQYRLEGKLEEAFVEYQKFRTWYPDKVEIIEEGILTLRAMGDTGTAARWADAALRRETLKEEEEDRIREALFAPAVRPVVRYY